MRVNNECETLVQKICGNEWKNLPEPDIFGAWGVMIVKSVLDGVSPKLTAVSKHLGIDEPTLRPAFENLTSNGVFANGMLERDRNDLNNEDMLAWCYYAGYSSGVVETHQDGS